MLQANFEELTALAGEANQLMEQLSSKSAELGHVIEQLRGGDWQGQTANAFYTECETLVWPMTNKILQSLQEVGMVFNQVTQLLTDTDASAGEFFVGGARQ